MSRMFNLRYPLLLIILGLLTSFSPQNNSLLHANTSDTSVMAPGFVKDKKRCGPFIFLHSVAGANVSLAQLQPPSGGPVSVTTPTLPYYFGQFANGSYRITLSFSSHMATNGLIAVVAQDGTWVSCKTFNAGVSFVSLAFVANVCQEYRIIVVNNASTCP